jgi:hypothetical protein
LWLCATQATQTGALSRSIKARNASFNRDPRPPRPPPEAGKLWLYAKSGWKVKTGEERVQKASGRNEIVSRLRNYDLYHPLSKASCRDFLLKGRYRLIADIGMPDRVMDSVAR